VRSRAGRAQAGGVSPRGGDPQLGGLSLVPRARREGVCGASGARPGPAWDLSTRPAVLRGRVPQPLTPGAGVGWG